MSRRRGFTLIELTVVIVVLSLLAAVIVPNLASQQASRERASFYRELRRIVAEGHESAIERKQVLRLRFEEPSTLTLESDPDALTADPTRTTESAQPQGEGAPIRTVELPDGVELEEFQVDGRTVSSSEWTIRFYPDGQTDEGGIALIDEETPRAMTIDRIGRAEIVEGTLPDPASERWEAGDYERRA